MLCHVQRAEQFTHGVQCSMLLATKFHSIPVQPRNAVQPWPSYHVVGLACLDKGMASSLNWDGPQFNKCHLEEVIDRVCTYATGPEKSWLPMHIFITHFLLYHHMQCALGAPNPCQQSALAHH